MKLKILLLALALTLCGCSAALADDFAIVATDFPCYDFARAVLGSGDNITLLIKPGSEAHSYDPTPSDIVAIMEADLFIYIGGESDEWVSGILASMGDSAPAVERMFDCVEAIEEESLDGHAEAGEYDEHIWTSPVNAVKMVRAIQARACALDPENADIYAANADNYVSEIEKIDARLRETVETGARREIIVCDRFPFLYLAREYALEYRAAFPGCAREVEPSAQTVMALIDKVSSDSIPVVYMLELSTGQIARTVASATGAQILTLHSAQNVTLEEFAAGETYVSIMRKNIDALSKGLN